MVRVREISLTHILDCLSFFVRIMNKITTLIIISLCVGTLRVKLIKNAFSTTALLKGVQKATKRAVAWNFGPQVTTFLLNFFQDCENIWKMWCHLKKKSHWINDFGSNLKKDIHGFWNLINIFEMYLGRSTTTVTRIKISPWATIIMNGRGGRGIELYS